MRRLEPGDTIGRYRIERRLGMGAMGEVFLAEDPQIGRRLAIKTVRVEEGRPKEIEERKQRLLREARAAGQLLHPRVVTLFDVGEDGELLYLAFEFIDGTDLADRLDEGPPLTVGQALAIARQAAEGLDYAHRRGIVHRDIKPSNLMLTASGEVKVADFGIAKMLDSTSDLTMTGSVVGSPHYLSPEQIRNEPLDGRTDVFSLGVLLYEILTRRRPFDGDTLTTLVYQILNEEPTPLAARRPDLGPRVDELVRRMMHKDRDERFGSAEEVAEAIAELEGTLDRELLERPAAPTDEASAETHLLPSTGAAVVPPPPPPVASEAETRTRAATAVTPATTPGVAPPAPPPPPVATSGGRGRWIAVGIAAACVLAVLAVAGLNARRFAAALGGESEASAETVTPPAAPEIESTAPAGEASSPPQAEPESASPAREEPAPPGPPEEFTPGEREPNPRREGATPAEAAPDPDPEPTRPVPQAPPAAPRVAAEPDPPPAAPEPEAAPPARERPAALDAETREALISRIPVAREMATGMKLSIQVEPKRAAERVIVRLDRIVLGRAADWDASRRKGRAYAVPEPGLHILSFLVDGTDVYRIRIDASPERAGPTPIVVNLPQAGRRPGRR